MASKDPCVTLPQFNAAYDAVTEAVEAHLKDGRGSHDAMAGALLACLSEIGAAHVIVYRGSRNSMELVKSLSGRIAKTMDEWVREQCPMN